MRPPSLRQADALRYEPAQTPPTLRTGNSDGPRGDGYPDALRFANASPRLLTPQLPNSPTLQLPPQSKIQNPKSKIYLLLGLPDRCHRYRPDWIKVAINGRVVRSPELEHTIMGAFRRTLPRDRHPICFVHLHLPPNTIDWNRHPAKLDIYLDRMEDWRKQVADAIAHTLAQHLSTSDTFYSERVTQLIKTAESPASYETSRRQTGTVGDGGGRGDRETGRMSQKNDPKSKIQNPKSVRTHP